MQEYKDLIRYLVNNTQIKDRAIEKDDLYQVASLAAHKALEAFDPNGGRSKRNWIILCVKHALWRVAKNSKLRTHARLDAEPVAPTVSTIDHIALREAFARASGRDRSILLLVSQGYDGVEIGSMLGVSRERVRQLIEGLPGRLATKRTKRPAARAERVAA